MRPHKTTSHWTQLALTDLSQTALSQSRRWAINALPPNIVNTKWVLENYVLLSQQFHPHILYSLCKWVFVHCLTCWYRAACNSTLQSARVHGELEFHGCWQLLFTACAEEQQIWGWECIAVHIALELSLLARGQDLKISPTSCAFICASMQRWMLVKWHHHKPNHIRGILHVCVYVNSRYMCSYSVFACGKSKSELGKCNSHCWRATCRKCIYKKSSDVDWLIIFLNRRGNTRHLGVYFFFHFINGSRFTQHTRLQLIAPSCSSATDCWNREANPE